MDRQDRFDPDPRRRQASRETCAAITLIAAVYAIATIIGAWSAWELLKLLFDL